MKKYLYMLVGTCICLSVLFAGCSEKEEIEWVMPSSTAQQEATETDASSELTVEEAEALLETEFAGYTVTYVEEVTESGVECYRFLITDGKEEADAGTAADGEDTADAVESPYDIVNDYYDVAKEGGKLVGRQISDEKAEAILKDAFADDSLEFVPTGEIVTIYELTYLEYQAEGMEDNIYITSTFGNEVFTGYYDETLGEWVVEIVATYGVNEE